MMQSVNTPSHLFRMFARGREPVSVGENKTWLMLLLLTQESFQCPF